MSQSKQQSRLTSRHRVPVNLLIGSTQSGSLAAGRLIFSLVALQLAATPWQAGLLLALFSIFPALFMIQIGRWMDRVGVYFILVATVAASLLLLLEAAWAPTLSSLMFAAPFIGIAAVVAHVSATRALGVDQNLALRARNLGYLGACYSVAHFVAPLAAGLMLDRFGSNAVFGLLALLPCITLAVIFVSQRSTVAPIPPQPDVATTSGILSLLQVPALRLWVVANAIFAMSLTIFPFVASLHADKIGLSAANTGWLIGAAAVGSVVIRVFMRSLMEALSPRTFLSVALTAAGAAYAAFAFFEGVIALALISFLLGLAVGAGMPVVMTMIYAEAPPDRVSEALGLTMAASMLLQTLTPMLMGMLASVLGIQVMACTLGLVLMIAAGEANRRLLGATDGQRA